MRDRNVKAGDIVEVHLIAALGPDRWVPARVMEVEPFDTFTVEGIGDALNEEGRKWLKLHLDHKNWRHWRP